MEARRTLRLGDGALECGIKWLKIDDLEFGRLRVRQWANDEAD